MTTTTAPLANALTTLGEMMTINGEKFQGFCPECGAVGPVVDSESAADDFEYAHRAEHEDTEY